MTFVSLRSRAIRSSWNLDRITQVLGGVFHPCEAHGSSPLWNSHHCTLECLVEVSIAAWKTAQMVKEEGCQSSFGEVFFWKWLPRHQRAWDKEIDLGGEPSRVWSFEVVFPIWLTCP